MKFTPALLFSASLAFAAFANAGRAATLDALVQDSPFQPKEREAPPVAPTQNATVEFRGLITGNDGTFFGLYDRTRQQSAWVRREDATSEYKVISYDPAAEIVNIEYQGQRLTLSLSTNKIAVAAPSAPSPPMAQAGVTPGQPGNPGEDTRRLESVATEVRRRRALRQSIAQPPAAPVTAPVPVPSPVQPAPALPVAPQQ